MELALEGKAPILGDGRVTVWVPTEKPNEWRLECVLFQDAPGTWRTRTPKMPITKQNYAAAARALRKWQACATRLGFQS